MNSKIRLSAAGSAGTGAFLEPLQKQTFGDSIASADARRLRG